MLGDNDQATSLAYEDRVTGGNKMIKQDYHYSKEQLEDTLYGIRMPEHWAHVCLA